MLGLIPLRAQSLGAQMAASNSTRLKLSLKRLILFVQYPSLMNGILLICSFSNPLNLWVPVGVS